MSDTIIVNTVTKEQVKQYLHQIGEDPESAAFAELFDSMGDGVQEEEWADLAAQFSDVGVQVDMLKASKMAPGMTHPGLTIPAQTLIGLRAVQAAEPDGNGNAGTDPNSTSDPPPSDSAPISIIPVEEGSPGPPWGTASTSPGTISAPDDEDQRATVPHKPVHQEPERKKAKGFRWEAIVLLAIFTGLVVVVGYKLYSNGVESAQSPQPTPTQPKKVSPAPPKEKPEPRTPRLVTTPTSTIVATCNVTRYGLRSCTFQANCTRSNAGSLYLEATCGNTQYRAQESEKVLPLGEGKKVTLVKNGT